MGKLRDTGKRLHPLEDEERGEGRSRKGFSAWFFLQQVLEFLQMPVSTSCTLPLPRTKPSSPLGSEGAESQSFEGMPREVGGGPCPLPGESTGLAFLPRRQVS